jgi:hypothetical protein
MKKFVFDFCDTVESKIREMEKKHNCILTFNVNTDTDEWFMSVLYFDGSAPCLEQSLGVCKFATSLRSAIRNWFKNNA